MDPISLAIGAVGLGMQIFGGVSSSNVAKQQAQVGQQQAAVSGNIATQEQGINDAKQAAMELQGRRTQLENVRNNQRARAQAVQSATTQGAQFGSGLQGGLGQIQDQSLFNMSGVNSALQTGRQIAGFNQNITGDKLQLASLGSQSAGLQGQAATDAGISSIGGALLKSGPMIGQLGQNATAGFKSMNFGQSLFGGGSPSGLG